MKNLGLIVGGVAVLGIAAFFIYKSKSDKSEDIDTDALEKKIEKEEPTTDAEAKDVNEAEDLLEEAQGLGDSPKDKSRAKEIADKLARIAKRTPVAAVIRAQIAVGKKIVGIAKQAGKSVGKAIDKMQEKGEVRRQCRKEADEKFGFPIRPKKIKEKIEFRKECKRQGGNDDFTSFSSDFVSNENEVFAFNGHVF